MGSTLAFTERILEMFLVTYDSVRNFYIYITKSRLKTAYVKSGPPLYSLKNDCIDLLLQHDAGQTRIYNPLFGKIGRLHRAAAPYLANCSMPSSRSIK